MMSALIVASIALAVALGYKTKINTGFFCIVFAYAIGCFGLGISAKELIACWPTTESDADYDGGCPRACLKIHSWHLHAPLRGIFVPNSLNVAHYAAFIWHKSPTKWHAQLPESNFQTRSRTSSLPAYKA